MDRLEILALIEGACLETSPFDVLSTSLEQITREGISSSMLECGIIPEMLAHDSSPEKLWAKYCDILLAKVLDLLGISSEVIRVRGNSADVRGKTAEYTLVGDAKAFRLSRSAKNQKDFKIKALDDWRGEDTFACLVAPLNQYPCSNSQIYFQAKQRNVTLLSYVHLKFLLDFPPRGSLLPLWKFAGEMEHNDEATPYWAKIDEVIRELTGRSQDSLKAYKLAEVVRIKEIGDEGISYWESVKKRYHLLTREEAIAKLVKAEKIDGKIRVIQKAINRKCPL